MAKPKKTRKTWPERDEAREKRISMEIVVDAYNEDERSMGWCGYMEEKLNFPFNPDFRGWDKNQPFQLATG